MPAISVVIPAYNAQNTIKETIQSVLNQTFSDFEIIVINDGSTDETLNIVQTISDPRLKVFSYANAGPSVSRNRGISNASGEFIAPLDSDDIWLPDKLEAQLNALRDYPQAAIAYSWIDHINEQGNFLRKGTRNTDTGNVYAKLLLVNFIVTTSNPLIRRTALTEVGEFNPNLKWADDRDMWIRLAARHEFVCVPAVHILYRQSSYSLSANIIRQCNGSITVLKTAFDSAPTELQYLRAYSYSNIYKFMLVKTLETNFKAQQSWIAIKLLFLCLKTDPKLITTKTFLKIVIRILVQTILPEQQMRKLLSKFGKALDIKTLFAYTTVEVPSKN